MIEWLVVAFIGGVISGIGVSNGIEKTAGTPSLPESYDYESDDEEDD